MAGRPTADDDEALELMAKRDDLSEWEEGFIESLAGQTVWSVKQGEKFDELWTRKMEG